MIHGRWLFFAFFPNLSIFSFLFLIVNGESVTFYNLVSLSWLILPGNKFASCSKHEIVTSCFTNPTSADSFECLIILHCCRISKHSKESAEVELVKQEVTISCLEQEANLVPESISQESLTRAGNFRMEFQSVKTTPLKMKSLSWPVVESKSLSQESLT